CDDPARALECRSAARIGEDADGCRAGARGRQARARGAPRLSGVHFSERPLDMIAHGGELLSDRPSDVMVIDVVAMDCCWTRKDRATVIRNIHAALADACGMKAPSPAWWINFRIIEEGSWGSRGGVLSFLDLLEHGPS